MSLVQRENKVAYAKGSTWGTAVQPEANCGLYVKGHTPPKGARKVVTNEDEFGRGMASESQVLEYEGQSGSMSLRVYYEGLEEIIASLMGTHSVAEDAINTGSYNHEIVLDTVMSSFFHTIAWDEGDEIKAVNSSRFVSGTFNYADGLNLDVNYLGDQVSVAGWSNLDTVTYPSVDQGVFKLSGATVQINAEGGAALGSGDELKPSGIDIAITRGFEALPVTAGSNTITEPIEKTAPVVEVTLNFPKKESETAAFLAAFNNRDYKKMMITFDSGDQIGVSGANYEIAFYFPRVFLMEAPDYGQDTPLPTTVKLKALLATSAPTGMDHGVPYIVMKNARDTVVNF